MAAWKFLRFSALRSLRTRIDTLSKLCRVKLNVSATGRNYKKAVVPVETRKQWASELQAEYRVSIVISCQVVGISRTAYYFRKRLVDDSKVIHELQDLVEQYPRWGFLKYFMQLRKLGYRWSHKRVQRVYSALKLQLRSKENFVPST